MDLSSFGLPKLFFTLLVAQAKRESNKVVQMTEHNCKGRDASLSWKRSLIQESSEHITPRDLRPPRYKIFLARGPCTSGMGSEYHSSWLFLACRDYGPREPVISVLNTLGRRGSYRGGTRSQHVPSHAKHPTFDMSVCFSA